jgi:hypothetical protein
MFFVVVIAIGSAVWLPHLVDREHKRTRLACAEAVDRKIAASGDEVTCPLSQKPLEATDTTVRCPNPELHKLPADTDRLTATKGETASVASRHPAPMGLLAVGGAWLLTMLVGFGVVALAFRFLF